MKLIVGLGNPGKEYENTRHNMGFYFLDNFAEKNNVKIDKKKFNGLYNELNINGEKYIQICVCMRVWSHTFTLYVNVHVHKSERILNFLNSLPLITFIYYGL